MQCHYEVLNVPRDADEGEIKLAYKKLALKWHPDKNLEDIENATEQFQLVQQAYEVLSDRQERAWYDNHREQILRGSSSDFKDNNLDVYQYFTTTCFKGYDDDDNGFYTVYRNIFEQIAKEDLEYMDFKEDFCNIPMFGNSTSDYNGVVSSFYDYWISYSTKKSYVWLDPYNIKEAKNRRVLKLIDKENEKIRQKARKERNEEVRGLVAFVRKRDKRVHAHAKALETRKLENRQKQQRISKQKRIDRLKELDESSEQAEWMKFENVQSELEEIERNLAQQFGDQISDTEVNENSDEEELDHLYCVACNKIFKNPKAFENHESSKKHRENVARLRETLIIENELAMAASASECLGVEDPSSDKESASNNDVDLSEETTEDSEFKNLNGKLDDANSDVSISDEELFSEEKTKVKKKKRKSRNTMVISEPETTSNADVIDRLTPTHSADDRAQQETNKKRKKKKDNKPVSSCPKTDVHEATENNSDQTRLRTRNQKKDFNKGKKINADAAEVDLEHTCVMCKMNFTSKNKLFDHLKKTGHSVYLDSSTKIEKKRKALGKEK